MLKAGLVGESQKRLIRFSSVLVGLQLPIVWIICSNFFPGYNSVAQSLSELSADDSPVKWAVRGSLILQAALIFAMSARITATAGRNLIRLSAVSLVLSALIASPSQIEYSTGHRVASFFAFAFGCLWPAFATVKGQKTPISRTLGVTVTVTFLALTLVGWSVWAFASQTYFGILQRVNILSQSLFIGWYWWRTVREPN